ncbi:MAG TPA: hypothetical protein VMY39_00600 [Planctomycetota bacterium]|nr:hypothetical protein [Planctomycetota bacterium]
MSRRMLLLTAVGCVVLGLCLADAFAAAAATQTKTGKVVKVDLEGKRIVVMVTRELTFSVTEGTVIVEGTQARKLADVKVGVQVKVDYTRIDDVRTATKISILAGGTGA